MHNRDVLKNAIIWLEKEMEDMQYGDVGVVFSLSKGEVTRIKRVNEVSVNPVSKRSNQNI